MFNHAQVKQILPHRYPLLLIDTVLDLVEGKYIKATKNITANEPCYEILNPIDETNNTYAYPLSLLIESIGQAACILGIYLNSSKSNLVPLFGSVKNVEIEKNVYPGDTIVHEVEIINILDDSIIVGGKITKGSEIVLTMEMAILSFKNIEEFKKE